MSTPSAAPRWGGRRAQRWTAAVLATYGQRCALNYDGCTLVATEGDHIVPRSVDLSRQYDVTNGRPACRHCNAERGNRLDQPPPVSPRFLRPSEPPGRTATSLSPDPGKNGPPLVRFQGDLS